MKEIDTIANERNPYREDITLSSIKTEDDRQVDYATAGDPDGEPVLFFYPIGSSRRCLLFLHSIGVDASIKLICVNRPGTGGTSESTQRRGTFIETVCRDCVCVLDDLGIGRTNLLFACAGTPFALKFSLMFPSRTASNLIGVACWVSPADCPCNKMAYKIGALGLPSKLICPLVASSMKTIISLVGWGASRTGVRARFRNKVLVSFKEREAFDTVNKEGDEQFKRRLSWTLQERSKLTAEVEVLLSHYQEVGIDYQKIAKQTHLFHPKADKITPFLAAEWFSQQLQASSLTQLTGASHEGVLFLLHEEIRDALKGVGLGHDRSV